MTAPNSQILHAAGVYVSLGGMPLLRDVHLELCPGEFTALLGGNGSGKTTFLRTLLGLIPKMKGEILWFGQPIEQFKEWFRIGYVPQHTVLAGSTATVAEVVASGLLPQRKLFTPLGKQGHRAIADALNRVELKSRANWPISKLSGGQQQRCLIARALIGHPEVLVMDEPMIGVDLITQDRLAKLFAELKSTGVAMLVVLHDAGSLSDLVDHSVTMHDGRIVQRGVGDSLHPLPLANNSGLGLVHPLEGEDG